MITFAVSWASLTGCRSPPAPPGLAELCPVTARTPLPDASGWSGPDEEALTAAVTAHPPARVDWDESTLDSATSPVSVGLAWQSNQIEIVERDGCPSDPIVLFVPVVLRVDVGEGGVEGSLAGELTADPAGTLTLRAEGVVEPVESWNSVGEAHVVDQGVAGEVDHWYATVKGPWTGAALRIDAVSIDGDRDWVTVLWSGHWSDTATQPPR
ncbi:MAG: hypothetical protein ABMB14_07300 [Myxococcota bacterium]